MFDGLDCLILVYRLDMHGHNLAGFHGKEICKQPVADIRCIDG